MYMVHYGCVEVYIEHGIDEVEVAPLAIELAVVDDDENVQEDEVCDDKGMGEEVMDDNAQGDDAVQDNGKVRDGADGDKEGVDANREGKDVANDNVQVEDNGEDNVQLEDADHNGEAEDVTNANVQKEEVINDNGQKEQVLEYDDIPPADEADDMTYFVQVPYLDGSDNKELVCAINGFRVIGEELKKNVAEKAKSVKCNRQTDQVPTDLNGQSCEG